MNIHLNTIICGDALEKLKELPDESADMVMTSPPYWALRDYGVDGQLGLEPTFQEYVNKTCDIFDEVKRVLKKEGTCWVNMGDTYGGSSSYSDGGRQGYKDKTGNMNKMLKATDTERMNPGAKDGERLKSGNTSKSLTQIPSRFAIEMCNRGWILRNEIIWYKPNCMPSSVDDRFTVDFEKIFFFTKNKKYYFEQQNEPYITQENRPDGIVRNREYGYDSKLNAMNKKKYSVREKRGGNKNPDYVNPKGRNKRTVWKIPTQPFPEAHFAVFPETLCETPIKAGCPNKGCVLDPFAGSGTTLKVAKFLGRDYIGIELNPEYIKIAEDRLKQKQLF